MRWQTFGAQAMLDLRAVYLNGEWDAFQKHRHQAQIEGLYPHRHEILAQWEIAAYRKASYAPRIPSA
ncbi:MAG: hypothetical protein NTW86_02535 [Candidatus Sumerlaeota bacterium]|nr:hypothetical protein [Candidatus Sumerlaeota bacterium]